MAGMGCGFADNEAPEIRAWAWAAATSKHTATSIHPSWRFNDEFCA
jgi:hypothetical protein